jgi:hypothetical protein
MFIRLFQKKKRKNGELYRGGSSARERSCGNPVIIDTEHDNAGCGPFGPFGLIVFLTPVPVGGWLHGGVAELKITNRTLVND